MSLALVLSGCQTGQVSRPDVLAEFDRAGPVRPTVDVKQLVAARRYQGAYRVVAGDVLALTMPAIVQASGDQLPDWTAQEPYRCRVTRAGVIHLPIVGALSVEGLNLDEIEDLVVQAYYPKYLTSPPAVVAEVDEYRTQRITVLGAVAQPGIHACASYESSVVGALMKAGGIIDEGAAVIRIRHQGGEASGPLALPVKGLNIPFVDVALADGDVVEVEGLNRQFFSVIGLVRQAGSFPYPAGEQYTLIEALAFAGGVDPVADPRFVKIYRQRTDGEIVAASFRIAGTDLASAGRVPLKPGDVVAVEHTDRTRTRLLLSRILAITMGANFTYRIDDDDL